MAIGVVLRRLLELIHPSQGSPPQMASLDAIFSTHAALSATHIIPAAIFVLLSAAVLLRPTSRGWSERLFFSFGAITGTTAYAMRSLGRRDTRRMREWMTPALAILLGIATNPPSWEYSSP
jgi:hypothetical protein